MKSVRTKRGAGPAGLASARARFEGRALAVRRRPQRVVAIAVGLLLLMGLLAWLGWYSPLLTAESVRVEGAGEAQAVRSAQAAQVRQVAEVPLGGPLLRVDTDAVRARLEADRRWAAISVGRSFPHTVVITVTPRVAALAVRLPGGKIDLVDASGFAFRTTSTPPRGVVTVTAGADSVTPEGLTAALQALGALGALDPALRQDVSAVTLSAADQVKFNVKVKDVSKTVVWGGPGDAALKARLVTVLLKQPETTVDVSAPRAPVTR